MSYSINKKNGTILINEGTLNTETSLQLVGKDYFGYGDAIAQSFVDLLQNFASDTAPTAPIEGQIWFDTANNFLRIWNTTTNDDTVGSWLSIDIGSNGPTRVYDSTQVYGGNTYHEVSIISDNSIPVAAFSSDNDFTVNVADPMAVHFPNGIKTGVTLSATSGSKFHGTATTAEYADLAELYSSDELYQPGTVVKLGGDAEVTQTTEKRDEEVFGVVSTEPAYLMNSTLQGTTVAVALAGRVPCKVEGEVKKGQRLTSSDTPGVAQVADEDSTQWQIIGRALEDKTTSEVGLIEVVVGVK